MEHLLIEDKWNVLKYDFENHIRPQLQGEMTLELSYPWLSVHLVHEEDLMLCVRFLVVNGRSFSYKFESEPNYDA